MLPSLHPALPARARIRRVTLPVLLTSSLVAGAVAAVTLSGGSASAAATTGTFAVGADAVQLNQPSDPGMGVLTPSADAAQNGMFGPQVEWPIVPLHASVARNGQLVTWGTPPGVAQQGGTAYDVWDAPAGFSAASHTDYASGHGYDSFCNAFTELADGRLLMIGGNSTTTTMTFDPVTGAETMEQPLNHPRWYGTSVRLTDGRILMLGGQDYSTNPSLSANSSMAAASTPEIGTGTGAWTDLVGARSDAVFGLTDNRWWYPRAFNGPNGTVVGTSADTVWNLSTAGTGSVQQVGTLPWNPGVSGSQVMYAPGKELIAGGGQMTNVDSNPGSKKAVVLDWSTTTPTITPVADMVSPANWLNLTVLPNGEVFANGGTKIGVEGYDWTNSVRQSEVWNPGTKTWRTAATAQRTRTYHSTSLLLPSGAVFTGGGGVPGPETNFNAELYYPAYLFTTAADGTTRWASRPAISAISGDATYGGTMRLTVADGRRIGAASLISLPSVTHSQNTDQRRVPLTISQDGGVVSATLPSSLDTLPPGDYELTVTDADGVASAAQILTIRAGAPGLVTVAPTTPTVRAATPATGGTPTMPAGGTTTGSAPSTGTGTNPGAGTTPAPDSGTTAAPTPGSGTGTAPGKAAKLPTGKAVGIAPAARTTSRLSHTGTKVLVRKAGPGSSKAVKRASSWIVRTGVGAKAGYSFESVDRRGWYLAAPAKGSGSLTLVKKSSSASFKARATFSSLIGPMRRDSSFRVTSRPTAYLRTDGIRVVVGALPASSTGRTAATFVVAKGLAAK